MLLVVVVVVLHYKLRRASASGIEMYSHEWIEVAF